MQLRERIRVEVSQPKSISCEMKQFGHKRFDILTEFDAAKQICIAHTKNKLVKVVKNDNVGLRMQVP